MTLFDYIIENNYEDFDVYDDVFDCCVTVCLPDEETDFYDKFVRGICKKVELLYGKSSPDDCEIIANWTGLIQKNMEKFKQFSNLHWSDGPDKDEDEYEYEDEDEYLYTWIYKLHFYVAGYASDSFYKTLYEFAQSLD